MKAQISITAFLVLFGSWSSAGAIQVQPRTTTPIQSSTVRPNLLTVQRQSVPLQNGGIVADVEKMLQAGTGDEVVKAYIQNWIFPYFVSADDILRLHAIGASTDVLTNLIRRGGELRAQAAQASSSAHAAAGSGASPQSNAPPVVIYQSAPSYTYSSPDISAVSTPYYYYNYYWYRNWPTYSSWYWPYYPFYTYPWYSRPWFKHGYYSHGYWGWKGHPYPHWKAPIYHGRWAGSRHWNWRSPGQYPGRSPGLVHARSQWSPGAQPWRPATAQLGRGSGMHHFQPAIRSAGSVGFRGPGMAGRVGGSAGMGGGRGGGGRR